MHFLFCGKSKENIEFIYGGFSAFELRSITWCSVRELLGASVKNKYIRYYSLKIDGFLHIMIIGYQRDSPLL